MFDPQVKLDVFIQPHLRIGAECVFNLEVGLCVYDPELGLDVRVRLR